MNQKMRKACLKAGLSEEEIKKMDQLFVADRVRLWYENKMMESMGITVATFSALEEIPGMMDKVMLLTDNKAIAPEVNVINKDRTETIHNALMTLNEEERELLRLIYDEMGGNVSAASERLGLPRETVRDRNNSILRRLKKFLKKMDYPTPILNDFLTI